MDALVLRDRPPSRITSCYRGSCRLPGLVQAVERDLTVEHGQAWLQAEWNLVADAEAEGARGP